MKKMIVRIDDVGFSDVCNIGSFETIEKGLATSADVMLDSPGTDDALRRLKNFPWISVGWHGHMWGTPVLAPSKAPSLIEKDGEFAGRFREDIRNAQDINYDEALAELRAQVKRCVDILGKTPDTCNPGGSSPWSKAVLEIADEYGIAHDYAVKKGADPRTLERIGAAKERGEKWAAYYQSGSPERMQDQEPAEQWKSRGIVIADGGLAYIDLLTDSVAEVEEHYDPVWAYMQDARNWNGVTRNYYKDEQYQSLLEKAMSVEGYSPESIGAFHDYMKSTATARGVMVQNYYSIWKEGAADIYRSRSGYALPTAFIFSDSWQRVNP